MNDLSVISDLQKYISTIWVPGDIVEIRYIMPKGMTGSTHSIWSYAKDIMLHEPEMRKKNAAGWGVYAGVNPRKGFGLRGDVNVALAHTIFVDFDDADVAEHGIAPADGCGRYEFLCWTLDHSQFPNPDLVVSSGHGLHAYWRLTKPLLDLRQWEEMQRKFIDVLHSDKSIKNPERIMRLPGFINTKYEPHIDVFIVAGGVK